MADKLRILYYAVGPIHPRNLQLIAASLADCDFHMIYEAEAWWMRGAVLRDFPFEKTAFIDAQVPAALDAVDFAAIVFSTVQPRPAPINLLKWAVRRDIPTIAIEESNQLASNNGTVNNYLLPVDHLLVASRAEEKGFIAAGVPSHRICVTGWPFYAVHRPSEGEERRAAKRRLGLDADRRVATLTLTGLNDTAGETPSVRRKLLRMAAGGLPEGFQLAVKPHPIEKIETLMPFMRECAPHGMTFDGTTSINEVLDITDILLNRGVSQVAIEALARQIPVIVLDTGKRTPFHELAPAVVADSAERVKEIIKKLRDDPAPMALYEDYRREHMPFPFGEAREKTCDEILRIATHHLCDDNRAGQWLNLALYEAWKVDRGSAVQTLQSEAVSPLRAEAQALMRLIRRRAGREDLDLLHVVFKGEYERHVLHCLWIDQLAEKCDIATADLQCMHSFPPAINVNLFASHCAKWAALLCRSGLFEEARVFAQKLERDLGHVPEFAEIIEEVSLLLKGRLGAILLAGYRTKRQISRIARKLYTLSPVHN